MLVLVIQNIKIMSSVECDLEFQVINDSDNNSDNYNCVKRKNDSENLFSKLKKTKLQDEINSKGRKTSSRVHKYFKKINNNNDAICLIENCEITVQSVCSTNLKNHLKLS